MVNPLILTFISILFTSEFIVAAETGITCNLVPLHKSQNEQFICDLKNIDISNHTIQVINQFPFTFDSDNQALKWINKYQPTSTRWSDLCPSTPLLSAYQQQEVRNTICLNQQNCDLSGVCTVMIGGTEISLIDTINHDTDSPKFTTDTKFINITIDLENLIYESDGSSQVVLIDSTDKLDQYRSKLNRVNNKFKLEKPDLSGLIDKIDCKPQIWDDITQSPFELRHDTDNERLYLRLLNNNIDFKQQTCFLYSISLKRDSAQLLKSTSVLMVKINDNRYERPIFDYPVYNFTITENSPIDSLIGNVNAVYSSPNADSDSKNNQIKYRIVPFVSFESDDMLNNDFPIRIDQFSGLLTQKLNIDREKYLSSNQDESLKKSHSISPNQSNGLVTFNVEASFESISYSYCKVNIFISDVNDNAPIARVRPVGNFGRNQNDSSLTNLYASEATQINQILAYIGLYDSDAGENGTIKSIDLTIVGFKKPSNMVLNQRKSKLNKLLASNKNDLIEIVKQQEQALSSVQTEKPLMPFRLNKISDKLFTLQLVERLDFRSIESYSVEMKIQDNGTRPQLESKTRINLSVKDINKHRPIFTNNLDQLELAENMFNDLNIIFKFEAIDLDDDKNGQVKYKIISNPFIGHETSELDSTFQLDANSGELRLLRGIKRESLSSDIIELVVSAYDQAEPSSKRLNATFKLNIKLTDLNNNKPSFGSNKYSFNKTLPVDTNEKYLKIATAIDLIDLDTFETNSELFLGLNINRTKSMLTENKNVEDNSKFRFKDLSCYKSFNLNLISTGSSPFLVLVESKQDSSINNVSCELSIWLDYEMFKSTIYRINQTSYEFSFLIRAQDNGNKSFIDLVDSEAEFLVKFNFEQEIKSSSKQLFELNLNHTESIVSIELDRLADSQFHELKSCIRLSRLNSESFNLINITNGGIKIKDGHLVFEQASIEEGVYLIDYYVVQKPSLISELKQIELIFYKTDNSEQELSKLLSNYNKHTESILRNTEPLFKNKLDSIFTLSQFQSLLFGNEKFALNTFQKSSVMNILLNNRSTFIKFITVTIVISFIVLVLFICCVFCVIKRYCARKSKNTNENKNPKNLNVVDDDFTTANSQVYKIRLFETNTAEKVNRYLDGLDSDLSSPNTSSPVDSKKNLIIPVDNLGYSNQSQKVASSTSSSSCISDEGCYGSSDFSSERESQAAKANKAQYNQVAVITDGCLETSINLPSVKSSISQSAKNQQNYYINNLSRFEKIYNTNSAKFMPQNSVPFSPSQIVTSISGSYV